MNENDQDGDDARQQDQEDQDRDDDREDEDQDRDDDREDEDDDRDEKEERKPRRGGRRSGHDLCPDEHPCEGYPPEDAGPPKSGCKCRGQCECECESKLPEGSVLRALQELRKELKVPPTCVDAPSDAKETFSAALGKCETDYEGIDALVKAYREYHCIIDCDLDTAEDQCKEIRSWCEQLDKKTRDCIEKTWYEDYERVEFRLQCCCLLEQRRRFERMTDCLEQARAGEARSRSDFDAVQNFLVDLKGRFTALTDLYDAAKTHVEAKNHEAACAIYLEFRKIYHTLHVLVLWRNKDRRCKKGLKPTPDGCRRPTRIKERRTWKWYRRALVDALKALLEAKYRTYCFEQARIDAKHCMEECEKELEEFQEGRQKNFVREATECGSEDF